MRTVRIAVAVLGLTLLCLPGLAQTSQPGPQNPTAAGSTTTTTGTAPVPDERLRQLQELAAKPASQGDQAQSDPLPIHVVYRFFFDHLAALDAVADRLEASGKDGGEWRNHEHQVAGLTADEGKALKKVAYDCNQAVKEQDDMIQTFVTAFRSQHPTREYLRVPPPPELEQLIADRRQIINSHIDDLRLALGDASFKRLDTYVQKNFHGVRLAVPPSPQRATPNGVQRRGQ